MRIWRLYLLNLTLILSQSFAHISSQQNVLATLNRLPIAFSSKWQLLGPFQVGTRGMPLHPLDSASPDVDSHSEAAWGADPVEYLGGFRTLEYDPAVSYHSSLATNGTVKWSLLDASQSNSNGFVARVDLDVSFPDVDWTFLQAVYGWAALQWQAWARGEITIAGKSAQMLVLYTEHVLEFWLDEKPHFGGDFYAFRKAPIVFHLSPGQHRLDVRLIRDVRAMGGIGAPDIAISLEARAVSTSLEIAENGILLPDIVDGRLASHLGRLVVRNNDCVPIEVFNIACEGVSASLGRTWSTKLIRT